MSRTRRSNGGAPFQSAMVILHWAEDGTRAWLRNEHPCGCLFLLVRGSDRPRKFPRMDVRSENLLENHQLTNAIHDFGVIHLKIPGE